MYAIRSYYVLEIDQRCCRGIARTGRLKNVLSAPTNMSAVAQRTHLVCGDVEHEIDAFRFKHMQGQSTQHSYNFV